MQIPPVEVGLWLQSVDSAYYKDLSRYGGKATSISVNWHTTENPRGQFHWESLNNYINGILKEAPNTRILLHVFSNSNWATEPTPTPPQGFKDEKWHPEMPAKDISDWKNYIRALVTEFKGRVSIYALSNEAAAPQNWSGGTDLDFSKYAAQLKALYVIVKEVDPGAYVTNDGTSSGTNLFAYGYRALYQNEPSPHQNAINYFNESMKYHGPSGFPNNMTEEAIEKMRGGYMDKFWDMLLANKDYIDFVNLHWYQTTDRLPETLDWIQTQFPGKPLQLWETAFAWDIDSTSKKIGPKGQKYQGYDLTEQAKETFKLLTLGAAYGGWVQLWPWTSREEDPYILNFPVGAVYIAAFIAPSGTPSPTPNPLIPVPFYRPAANTFKVVTDHLNGAQFQSKVNLGNQVTAFKFVKENKEIYAIWSQNPTEISLPLNSVSMVDINDATTYPSSNAIPVSSSPIIIEGILDNVTLTPSLNPGDCHQSSNGDANCDGKINETDYLIWEDEFSSSQDLQNNGVKTNNYQADFNSDGIVDMIDYETWRRNATSLITSITVSPTPIPIITSNSAPIYGANIVSTGYDVNQIKSTGITSTTFWLYLPLFINPQTKKLNSEKVLQAINNSSAERGNLDIAIHIMPQTNDEATQKKGFYLPDLSTYIPQLKDLINTLKGKVKFYSIANEDPSTWIDTVENYGKLLSESYQVIKEINSEAVVLDSGMSSTTLGVIITNSKYQTNPDDAFTFLKGYFAKHSGGKQFETLLSQVNSSSDLPAFFGNTEMQKFISFGKSMFQNADNGFCPYYDAFQVHYYQEWNYLSETLSWIKDQMIINNCLKPIQIWELGYGLDQDKTYDVNYHAQSVPKYLTIASADSSLINYVTFYKKNGFAKWLFDTPGQDYPPGIAFRTTINKLTNTTFSQKLNLGDNIWAYQFKRSSDSLYVIWSDQTRTVSLPLESAIVTDITGQITSSNPNKIYIGVSPIFVEESDK